MNATKPIPPKTNDEAEWKAYNEACNKPVRTIIVQELAWGGFAITEGDRHNLGMGWDEMLGHLAAMTMPDALKQRGHIYPMTTDAEDEQREKWLLSRRKAHADFQIPEQTDTEATTSKTTDTNATE